MSTIDKLAFNPNLLTYGMIGMTTVILAALTVFDSTTTEAEEKDEGFVSQLLGKDEQNEAGLISSILPASISGETQAESQMGGKTRRKHHNKKKHRKTRHHKK